MNKPRRSITTPPSPPSHRWELVCTALRFGCLA